MDVVDVVCGGGVVCYGLQNVGGIVNFVIWVIFEDFVIKFDVYSEFSFSFSQDGLKIIYNVLIGGIGVNGFGGVLFYFGICGGDWCEYSDMWIDDLIFKGCFQFSDGYVFLVMIQYYDGEVDMFGGFGIVVYCDDLYQLICFYDKFWGCCILVSVSYEYIFNVSQKFNVIGFFIKILCSGYFDQGCNFILLLCEYWV